jgi:O-antigen ligase
LGQWLGRYAEQGFLLYLMLSVSGAAYTPQGPLVRMEATSASSITDSLFAVFYLVLALLILMHLKGVVRAAVAHWWTLLLIFIMALSWLWSTVPQITFNRTIAVLATCSVGWYLVARYSARDILRLVAIPLAFTAILSLFYGVFDPGVASGVPWIGVYVHKNVLARAMVLLATLCLLLLLEPSRWRWLLWMVFALSCVLVALSQSAGGVLILIALTILIRFSAILRLRMTLLIPLLILCGLLVAGASVWLQQVAADLAGQVGKDSTLTGRTDLWRVAILMIQRHPWLGYGFGGFWRGPVGDSGEFWRSVRWEAPHAHNGFIDFTLDLGLVGVTILVLAFATALAAAVSRARSSRTISATAPLVILLFYILYNLTESSMLRHNTLFLILYAVATSMALGGKDAPRAGSAVGPELDQSPKA